jgi:hypothetical protein
VSSATANFPSPPALNKIGMWSWLRGDLPSLAKRSFRTGRSPASGAFYEDIAKAIGVIDRKAPVSELIARKLIELAKAGERDPESLKELTIEAVRSVKQ